MTRLEKKDCLALAAGIRADLEALYGPRLRGVFLFGSRARDDADEESDVDLLIVLDDFESYWAEIVRTGETIARHSLEAGVSVSRVFAKQAEWREGHTPFLDTVRREALAA